MTERVLPSWRPGPTRSAIEGFLDRVEDIPVDHRVAVFDNDGTMWCEKPSYTQLEFFLLELKRAAKRDPDVGKRPEYRAILDGDMDTIQEMGLERIAVSLLDLFVGLQPEEFDANVAAFFAEQVHPDRLVPYRRQRYQPMLELIDELRAHRFAVYIVSAGGAEFVRVISNDFYAVAPEGIVGSQIDYDVERDDQGILRLVRSNRLVASGPNEGPTKVPNIQRVLGRRPVVAGGNSAGDAEMLEYATTYDGPSLALLVDHDDDEREYAYESKAGTFDTEETIVDTANRLGWTVVSMRNDWSRVFPD